MLFVASKEGGLIQCAGGPHKMPNGEAAVKAITWNEVDEICAKLNRLNPYDRNVVSEILKVEDCNFDHSGDQHQLYGLAVSAKRYVVYTRKKDNIEIINPANTGWGSCMFRINAPATSQWIAKIKRPVFLDGSLKYGSGCYSTISKMSEILKTRWSDSYGSTICLP